MEVVEIDIYYRRNAASFHPFLPGSFRCVKEVYMSVPLCNP